MVNAATGMMIVQALLATQTAPIEIPRLQPRRIETITPASEGKP